MRTTSDRPRFVTPLLCVGNWIEYDFPDTAAVLILGGDMAYVANDDDAAATLRILGDLDECCIADRLSVSHGGPVLCTH